MNRDFAFLSAPRCTATSKRTGARCKAPAMRGWTVCRFHGARGGGPKGARNGRYRHGRDSQETIDEYRRLLELLRPRSADVLGRPDGEET
jgi:hypothetical protein